ncbi:hypothetical protein L6164_019853 [Bauhinia variegata]|uniref:Uncharacterized protein n=1 Tax=Bauhinia variegata TaxID=167791 RepID=A0ACB9MV74_BAUVA|nr:hypothetical protein L6164_019853 [Bauhinia variegata]
MGTKSIQGKLEFLNSDQVEEEDEEALSLCDLPVNLIKEDDRSKKPDSQVIETLEEFDFGSWGGTISTESEMCAADEIFFQGQLLPLRRSFSSVSGFTTTGFQPENPQLKRCESRSESLDHGSLGRFGFRSSSSRSSSLRSQNSSSSTCSTTLPTTRISKYRVRNQFHTNPSPKPHLRVSVPRQSNFGNQGRKSSAWDYFRLGVVPTPEIGLQELKARNTNSANKNCVSRNSSSGSSSNRSFNASSTNKSDKLINSTHHSDKRNHVFKQLVGKGGGFLSGCKCSAQSDVVIIKSGIKSTNKTESATHAMKEKVLELKKQKQRQKQGKRATSRRRTFEWLKELSHESQPDEEALLSNS